ncbi:SAM-dependent methyltransferase, partial [Lipingzhangella sp. LS1_29]
DPIVLAHGRALLAEDASTTVITADITDPEAILAAEETRTRLDFSRPIAVLLFSIPHCIPDDDAARRAVRGCLDHTVSGSYLALSHIVADDAEVRAAANQFVAELGMPWKTRAPEEVAGWLTDLEPVDPGLGDITRWRPDPNQPPLPDPHPIC